MRHLGTLDMNDLIERIQNEFRHILSTVIGGIFLTLFIRPGAICFLVCFRCIGNGVKIEERSEMAVLKLYNYLVH